jgi:hypothetical protein
VKNENSRTIENSYLKKCFIFALDSGNTAEKADIPASGSKGSCGNR